MRWLRVVALAVVVFIVSACQVDLVVDVEVEEDGSGVVRVSATFDAEVVEAVPELRGGLQNDDLAAGGWILSDPDNTPLDGSLILTASKDFSAPEQLPGVLDEIFGPNSVFNDFVVERQRTFARTTYELRGTLDPSVGVESIGDAEITQLLGFPLGRSLEDLESEAGRPLDESITFEFSAMLPDAVEATTTAIEGRKAIWNISPSDPVSTEVEVTASVEDRLPRLWAAIALIALSFLGMLIVFSLLGLLGRRRAKRDNGGDDELALRRPERRPNPDTAVSDLPTPVPQLRVVVLDARGVLYDEANEIGQRLVPFVRERGGEASIELINQVIRSASLGRMSTTEIWSTLGVEGDAKELDAAYADLFHLREGVLEFIDELHARGLRVAVATNNTVAWSRAIRARFDLGHRVDTWVVSSEIGAVKPERAFFEAIRRMTRVPFSDTLVLDDQAEHLDKASELGFATAMFVPISSQLPASDEHPFVHGFDKFFASSSSASGSRRE